MVRFVSNFCWRVSLFFLIKLVRQIPREPRNKTKIHRICFVFILLPIARNSLAYGTERSAGCRFRNQFASIIYLLIKRSFVEHEEQRYVRAWIAPRGRSINLAILEHTIFSVPVEIYENRWYHICQSWNNKNTIWQLYFNGVIKSEGIQTKVRNYFIAIKQTKRAYD